MIRKLFFVLSISLMFITEIAFAGNTLTEDNPITFNKNKGTVSFLAEVNGKYFYRETRHFAAWKDGSNGKKAVFKGLVPQLQFYEALVKAGALPGNNMTLENKETTNVEGTEFEVFVSWEGSDKQYSIDDVLIKTDDKPVRMKFGGNVDRAILINSGCLQCLDSCPVGVVSNSVYTYGAITKRKEASFKGNKNLLPKDGTKVVITLKIKN